MDSSTTTDLRRLTAAAIERGDFAVAADMIASMFATDPNDARAQHQWARLLLAKGETNNAVQAMRQAADLAPLDAPMRLELAQMLAHRAASENPHFRDATWVEARSEAQRALAIQSDHAGAHLLIDRIEEQRMVDSLATADTTPHTMLHRTTPTRQYALPKTTARMANNHAIWWAVTTLALFALVLVRVVG